MKSLLLILIVGLICAPLPAAPAAPGPETELVGQVHRVIPQGVVIRGTIEAPGETWDGTFVLIGYPEQKTAATGDTLPHVVGRRVENIAFSKATLRAYQFVRAGRL